MNVCMFCVYLVWNEESDIQTDRKIKAEWREKKHTFVEKKWKQRNEKRNANNNVYIVVQ